MSGTPAARCSTFGNADFIRVPFPAARTTIWRWDGWESAGMPRLLLATGLDSPANRGAWRVERLTKRVEFVECPQVRIL